MPTPDTYVMIALLDDGGSARLGTARYYPVSQTFRLAEGNLEVPAAARGIDDVYSTDSGHYRIMTPSQHLELKKQEAMAAAEAAQVAITPKLPVPMPITHMASLNISPPAPAPTGCGLHAQISTVIAVGPANVELAARRAEPLAMLARKNNNVVTHVVLGAATDADALAALQLPTPRVFLAGANELVALRDRSATGPIRQYLKEAVLVASISPTAKVDSSDPDQVLWLLPASPVPLDGTLAALVQQMRRTLLIWSIALNTQWREWYERYNGTRDTLNAEEEALLRAYTSFPVVQRHPPLSGLTRSAMGLIGTIEGAPVGLVDHTIGWAPQKKGGYWPVPSSRWATTGTPTRDGSVYWAVASWCMNTQAAVRVPPPLLDHQLTFNDLEYDVTQVLATLLTHTLQGGARPYRAGMTRMKGVLGPVVVAGRGGNEPMRLTYWTLEGAPAVTLMLPEAYAQDVLSDYNVTLGERVLLSTQGFSLLARSDEVAIAFSGLSDAELDSERTLFGSRLWVHAKSGAPPLAVVLPAVPARAMIAYRTQLDANAKPNDLIVPGTRVVDNAGAQSYYTVTTSEDSLCGLRVCWSSAEGRPILDVDTFEGGAQVAYEFPL